MSSSRSTNPFTRPGSRPAFGAVLLGLFLSVQFLAASAALHHALHEHAGETDHQCAVQLLTHQQIDVAGPGAVLPPRPAGSAVTTSLPVSVWTATLDGLPRGRAPPLLPS